MLWAICKPGLITNNNDEDGNKRTVKTPGVHIGTRPDGPVGLAKITRFDGDLQTAKSSFHSIILLFIIGGENVP